MVIDGGIRHGADLPVVLLVEDDPVAAAVVSHKLDELGLVNPLITAVDLPDALDWLKAAAGRVPLAVVLLDVYLPGGSGLDLLRWLRSSPAHRETPVIMLTASSELWEVNEAHHLGISSYLVKPVGLAALGDMIRGLSLPWAFVADAG